MHGHNEASASRAGPWWQGSDECRTSHPCCYPTPSRSTTSRSPDPPDHPFPVLALVPVLLWGFYGLIGVGDVMLITLKSSPFGWWKVLWINKYLASEDSARIQKGMMNFLRAPWMCIGEACLGYSQFTWQEGFACIHVTITIWCTTHPFGLEASKFLIIFVSPYQSLMYCNMQIG
jgi:hypothetical protein